MLLCPFTLTPKVAKCPKSCLSRITTILVCYTIIVDLHLVDLHLVDALSIR